MLIYTFPAQAVRRSLQSLKALDKIDDRVTFHLLTTVDKAVKLPYIDDICLEAVPLSFLPSKARFKARSLEWFRLSRKLCDSDWILHLDEETIVDQYALLACVSFIELSTFQIGQVSYCEQFQTPSKATSSDLSSAGCHFF
jgi:hypothetical protein